MKKSKMMAALLSASLIMSAVPLESAVVFADEAEETEVSQEEQTEEIVEESDDSEAEVVIEEEEPVIMDEEISVDEDYEITETDESVEVDVSEDTYTFEPADGTSNYSRTQAVMWANSQEGTQTAPDETVASSYPPNTALYAYQISRIQDGSRPTNWLPDGWCFSTTDYQPGDIVVWYNQLTMYEGLSTVDTKTIGHVGIITECYTNGFVSVDHQYVHNLDKNYQQDIVKRFHYYSEIAVAIRPDFQDAAPARTTLSGWNKIGGMWYYFDNNGIAVTGERTISGKHYFFNDDATMFTGWRQVGNKWYYYGGSGYVTGWYKIGKSWYYFNSSGAMLTGWQKLSSKWYYFNSSGKMLTGWQKLSGKWYFFESSGAMKTGWYKTGGKWYYFNSSGVMATGSVRIGNKTYRFNSSGVCLNP